MVGTSVLHFVIANQQRINRKPHNVITVAYDRNRKTRERNNSFSATLRVLNAVRCMLLVIEIETVQNNNKREKKFIERKIVPHAKLAQT